MARKSLLIQKIEALIKPYPTAPPTEVLPPQLVPTLTYQIELQRNGRETRKAFCKKLSSKLRRKGLEQLIRERKEHVLKDLILVELINQEQLPRLKKILQGIESQLGTKILLKRW